MAELSHSTGFNLSQYESDSIFIMCFITFVTLSSVQCCSASSSLLYIHIWIIYSWKTCTTIWKYFCCTISDLVAFFYMLYLWWMWHMKLVITCTSSCDTTCLCNYILLQDRNLIHASARLRLCLFGKKTHLIGNTWFHLNVSEVFIENLHLNLRLMLCSRVTLEISEQADHHDILHEE